MLSCFSILLVLVVNVNSRPKKNYYLVDTVGKGYTCNIIYLCIYNRVLEISNKLVGMYIIKCLALVEPIIMNHILCGVKWGQVGSGGFILVSVE